MVFHLNTSHVKVNQCPLDIEVPLIAYLNTSHVKVNLKYMELILFVL